MGTKYFPVLCGGTFFTLLLEAARQGRNERKKWGQGTEFTAGDVLDALFRVAMPTFEKPSDNDSFKSVVSAYKSCNTKKSGQLPIHGQAGITTFDNSVKTAYHVPLMAMNNLVEKYLDVEGKGVWLIRALLDLICNDEKIGISTPLYVSQNGHPISKSALSKSENFCVPAILLGIWHFIVVNKVDNGIGRDTYNEWCRPGESPNTREPFQSDIGKGISQAITIEPIDSSESASADIPTERELCEESQPDIEQPVPDADPKRITVHNHGTVQNQKFISIETMNGDIHL